jgi:hypothetical protein
MTRSLGTLFAISLLLASTGCATFPRAAAPDASQVPRATKEELLSRIDAHSVEVIDVRRQEDWEASSRKIVGARREIPEETPAWSKNFSKTTPIVLYCA